MKGNYYLGKTGSASRNLFVLLILVIIFVLILYLNFFKQKDMIALGKKQVLESIPYNGTGEMVNMRFYFSSKDGMFLVPEDREVPKTNTVYNQIKIVLLELLSGTRDTNLVNVIPQGVNINEVYIDQQSILYVDFNSGIKDNQNSGSTAELLTIYSIVNTMTENFPEVKKVQILVNGDTMDSLAGHIDISRPINPDTSIIKVLQKW